MCGTKNRKGWDSCQNRSIPAEYLEAAVSNAVLNKLLTQDSVTALLVEINAELNGPESAAQIAHLQGRLHALNRTMVNLIDLAEKLGGTEEVLARLRQQEKSKLV